MLGFSPLGELALGEVPLDIVVAVYGDLSVFAAPHILDAKPGHKLDIRPAKGLDLSHATRTLDVTDDRYRIDL